jgi:phosphate-selective porin OprO/OprP
VLPSGGHRPRATGLGTAALDHRGRIRTQLIRVHLTIKDTDRIFKHLGAGVGYSLGSENYALFDPSAVGLNHLEQTSNNEWVTSSGVPFAVYNTNVRTMGQRTRIAPHLFWYVRFSLLAEYNNNSRELTNGSTTGRSTQRAYQVTASYYLTGERDFGDSGIQG